MHELVITRYPKKVKLLNGREITIRILQPTDYSLLVDFFRRFPETDKHMLGDNVNDPQLIESWCMNINLGSVFPLVALDKGKIIADCTLHQNTKGWQSHVGKFRITTDPEYRGVGLTKAMVNEFVEMAPDLGLTIIDAEIVKEQPRLIDLFQQFGFSQVAVLPDHAIDQKGNVHDLIIMSLKITPEEPGAQ